MIFLETAPADVPERFRIRVAVKENVVPREWLTSVGIIVKSCTQMLATAHRSWLCAVDRKAVGFAQSYQSNGELWGIAAPAKT